MNYSFKCFQIKLVSAMAFLLPLLVLSCASSDMMIESTTPANFEPVAGKSVLYFIRPDVFSGAGLMFTVYVDEITAGELPKGTYFKKVVNPGSHQIKAETVMNRTFEGKHQFDANKVYFIVNYLVGWGQFLGVKYEIINDLKTASEHMEDCTYTKPDQSKF